MSESTDVSRKSLVLRYFHLWNTGEVELAEGLLAPDFRYHSYAAITDADSLRSTVERARSGDPNLHVYVDAVLGADSMVTVVGRIVSGPERIVRSAVWTIRVDDQIKEIWTYRDVTDSN